MRTAALARSCNQAKLQTVRERVAQHRTKDVDLVVSIIGLNPNWAAIEPHLGKKPAKITAIHQQSLPISLGLDDTRRMQPNKSHEGWHSGTNMLPPYKNASFGAYFEIKYKSSYFGYYLLAMLGSEPEADLLDPFSRNLQSRNLEHVEDLRGFPLWNVLAFAKIHVQTDSKGATPSFVLTREIQSSLFARSVGLTRQLRNRYKYWDRVFTIAIEDYASFLGAPLVWMATSDFQMRNWKYDPLLTIHPMTAFNVYARTPQRRGYVLREIEPMVIDSTTLDLVWEKEIPQKPV